MRSATTSSKCLRHPTASGARFTARRRNCFSSPFQGEVERKGPTAAMTRSVQEHPMYQTTYHCPSSVDEATGLFAKGKEAKYLAGGQTLIPVMKQRLASPSDVIDLGKIKELVGIDAAGDTVTIKAATTHYDVASSAAVQKAIPALAYLASVIGDPAVRHRGTIGGSLANNDPSADYPSAVLALGATVKTNKRSIADSFFQGLFATAIEDGEIITALLPGSGQSRLRKVPASRLALCADRRVRRQDKGRRCASGRDRRFAERRHAGSRHRSRIKGQLVGRRARQRHDTGERPDERHPRLLRVPRQLDQGNGAARGDGRGLIATQHKMPHMRRADRCAPHVFYRSRRRQNALVSESARRDNFRQRKISKAKQPCSTNQLRKAPSALPAHLPVSALSNSPASVRVRSPA